MLDAIQEHAICCLSLCHAQCMFSLVEVTAQSAAAAAAASGASCRRLVRQQARATPCAGVAGHACAQQTGELRGRATQAARRRPGAPASLLAASLRHAGGRLSQCACPLRCACFSLAICTSLAAWSQPVAPGPRHTACGHGEVWCRLHPTLCCTAGEGGPCTSAVSGRQPTARACTEAAESHS